MREASERSSATASPETVQAKATEILSERMTAEYAKDVHTAKAPESQRIIPDVFKTAEVDGAVVLDRSVSENVIGTEFKKAYIGNILQRADDWVAANNIPPVTAAMIGSVINGCINLSTTPI